MPASTFLLGTYSGSLLCALSLCSWQNASQVDTDTSRHSTRL